MAEAIAQGEPRRGHLLTQVQAVSGLTFLTFVAIHLFNTFLAAAGPGPYDDFQSLARTFYQHAIKAGQGFFHGGGNSQICRIRIPYRPRPRIKYSSIQFRPSAAGPPQKK